MELIQTNFNIPGIKDKTFDKKVSKPFIVFSGNKTSGDVFENTNQNSDLAKKYLEIEEVFPENPLLQKMSGRKFREMKKSEGQRSRIQYNKYNIQLAEQIMSDKKLSNDEEFLKKAVRVIEYVTSPYNLPIGKKILSDGNLYNNERVMDGVSAILYFTNTQEKAKDKVAWLEKISTDERFKDKSLLNYSVVVLKTNGFTEEDLLKNLLSLTDRTVNIGGKDVPRFNPKEIMDLGKVLNNVQTKDIVLDLLKLPVKTDEEKVICPTVSAILNYANLYEKNLGNRKLLKNPEIQKCVLEHAENLKGVNSFSSDNFLELNMKDKILHFEINDKGKPEVIGEEITTKEDDKKTAELKIKGASIKLVQYFNDASEVKGYIETLSDKDGNPVSRTLTKKSKKNPEVLIVLKEVFDKNGDIKEVKKVGTVENYGEKGEKRIIKREFISPLGNVSRQSIMETPHIKSSKFEVASKKFERRFRQYDDYSSDTVAWGNAYKTKITWDGMDVTVIRKDGTSDTAKIKNEQIDYRLLPLIGQIPGDYLYVLAKTGTKVSYGYEKNNACFDDKTNTICISKELKNDPFVFMHEFGHMADEILLKGLSKDSDLKEIYQKEIDAYKEHSSVLSEEQVQYFVNKNHNNKNGRLTEVIAETNAILSGVQHTDNSCQNLVRTKLLQENFPETIAYIGSKLEKAMQEL